MTPERFRTIVEAYGADARRWPEGERAAAQVWAEAHPAEVAAWLDEAAQLDGRLAAHRVAAPSAALVERVLAAGTAALAPRRAARRAWAGLGFWWPSAAFAGAGLAGGLAGALAVSLLLLGGVAPSAHDAGAMTTGFGRPGSDWSIDASGRHAGNVDGLGSFGGNEGEGE
jgi:hypothetical protein